MQVVAESKRSPLELAHVVMCVIPAIGVALGWSVWLARETLGSPVVLFGRPHPNWRTGPLDFLEVPAGLLIVPSMFLLPVWIAISVGAWRVSARNKWWVGLYLVAMWGMLCLLAVD